MGIVTHFPPEVGSNVSDTEPMLFLAGPIQGAPDWQSEVIETLVHRKIQLDSKGQLHVANPRRSYLNGEFNYEDQVRWEKRHILRSAKFGAVLFWFAKQDPTVEYEAGRSYAQTSRVEFGRVCGWKDYARNINLVIGIEPGYSGSERYFRSCAEEYDLPIYEDLDDSVNAAMKLIYER